MQTTINRTLEKTGFQSQGAPPSFIDLRTDVVFVYGWNDSLPMRIKEYRSRGYRVHFMTGVAWGEYDYYFNGGFDDQVHLHEAQAARNGERLDHGNHVFYIVPTPSYIAFLKDMAERVIDLGVEALHLEEPEIWSRAGYSEAFQALWQENYNEPWQPPHNSANAWFKAARLKHKLYTDVLEGVFTHAKAYAASKGRSLKCYVDTHSLINYAQWGLVSPESNLAHLNSCDGYVCQVWTGTARTPNHVGGVRKERTFQTAYLEYGQMAAMVLATGRRVWILADPIEDDPRYDWEDYRRDYHCTLTASLMHPDVNHYEIMPWPERVFNETYPGHLPADQRSHIPASYATELLTISNTLANMPDAESSYVSGTQGIAVAVADSLLFERGFDEPAQAILREPNDIAPPDQIYRLRPGADPEFDNFFGLTLPLVDRGLPLRLAHLEHAGLVGYLASIDVLILSYDAMKPPQPETHQAIADWVRDGGVLIYYGIPEPLPFDEVEAWWRQGAQTYEKPANHLFELLGVQPVSEQQAVGNGKVFIIPKPIGELAQSSSIAEQYVTIVEQAYGQSRMRSGLWNESNTMRVQRGPYLVARLLESAAKSSVQLDGVFLDLFDSHLPIVTNPHLGEERQSAFLYDLGRIPKPDCILAATGRVESEDWADGQSCFVVSYPAGVQGQLVIRLEKRPLAVRLNVNHSDWKWDETHNLLRVWYEGNPLGTEITVVNS